MCIQFKLQFVNIYTISSEFIPKHIYIYIQTYIKVLTITNSQKSLTHDEIFDLSNIFQVSLQINKTHIHRFISKNVQCSTIHGRDKMKIIFMSSAKELVK